MDQKKLEKANKLNEYISIYTKTINDIKAGYRHTDLLQTLDEKTRDKINAVIDKSVITILQKELDKITKEFQEL